VLVEAYITDNAINLIDILGSIIISETVFGDPDCITIMEMKLKAFK
jgi:hypothetical protein